MATGPEHVSAPVATARYSRIEQEYRTLINMQIGYSKATPSHKMMSLS